MAKLFSYWTIIRIENQELTNQSKDIIMIMSLPAKKEIEKLIYRTLKLDIIIPLLAGLFLEILGMETLKILRV